jgi:arylformamidase
MREGQVVELSQRMIPGKEHYKLEVKVDDVTNVLPYVKHRKDLWYVLGEVSYCTHIGTHIEVPFHHVKGGRNVADLLLHKLIGPCVVLNFTHKKDKEPITLDELKVHDGRIHAGDIVFFRTDLDRKFRTPEWDEQPYLTEEASSWLAGKKINCVGTDATGLEVPGTDYQPTHTTFLQADIPFIESLTNLAKVEKGDWMVFILPPAIEGLDASPVRIAAIRKEDLR